MTILNLAGVLALVAAIGHSYLSERLFLGPLRAEEAPGTVFSKATPKKLVVAMFHLASVCWASMAVSLWLLDPTIAAHRGVLFVFAAVFAVSGLGNFWAVGRPHPGGVLLLTASVLVLFGVLT